MVVESQRFESGRSAHDEEVRLPPGVARFDVDVDALVCSRDDFDYWNGTLNDALVRRSRRDCCVCTSLSMLRPWVGSASVTLPPPGYVRRDSDDQTPGST